MSSIDRYSDSLGVISLAPAVVSDNTTQVGLIIDTQCFHALTFFTSIGAIADADATFTFSIEDGDDAALSDAAPVDADKYLLGTLADMSFTQANANSVRQIGYVGVRRYVRATYTIALNTGDANFGQMADLERPRVAPTKSNV